MKKWFGLFLFIAILMTICVSVAEKAEPEVFTDGDYKYIVLADGTAEITKYSGLADELIIPDALNGIKISSIGDKAFCQRNFLTSVTIPDSVTSIGDWAFSECYFLTSVTIPDSVTSIGASPFLHNWKLDDIAVSPDHPYVAILDGVLFSKPDKRLICYLHAFAAESYEIPQGIQVIGDRAFDTCRSLTSVTIPDSVMSIGDKAFIECESLTSVTISDGVTSIGDYAFYGCKSLTSVTIPDSVKSIGVNPFCYCKKLTDIVVSIDNPYLAIIDGVLFSKADKQLICYPYAFTAKSYEIPQGIQVIGDQAFSACKSLTSVTIPDSVTSIGYEAFNNCESLTSVTIPDSVTSIGVYAFEGCSSLTSVTIPDSVTSIGDSTFSFCRSLTSVTIPDSVTSIGDYAFYWCKSLTSITIPNSVTSIGEKAFHDHQDGEYIPNSALTCIVERDSYAKQYCKENGIKYTYPDANNWLNN